MKAFEALLIYWPAALIIGVTLLVMGFAFFQAILALTRDRPVWTLWEGSIVTGIKLAEKEIPSTVQHAGLARLERALEHVVQVYRIEHRGRFLSKRLVSIWRQAIQLKHEELERYGSLRKGV